MDSLQRERQRNDGLKRIGKSLEKDDKLPKRSYLLVFVQAWGEAGGRASSTGNPGDPHEGVSEVTGL